MHDALLHEVAMKRPLEPFLLLTYAIKTASAGQLLNQVRLRVDHECIAYNDEVVVRMALMLHKKRPAPVH